MFIDEAIIHAVAGRGGDGIVSFRREKFVPKGGPDGGDGGDGGDILFVADQNLRTLLPFRHQTVFRGGNGRPGMGKQMSGPRGADCVVRVPVGTLVQDEQGNVIADLVEPGRVVVLAHGGRGGKGNVHFKSSVRRAPRIATEGTDGQEYELHLTLKLLADVGLVGLPNVGKSTLLRRLSNATPRVGDYPFTTLRPMLGIVAVGDYDSLVMADLPGLIEGAHEGRGLGTRFLRHIERTRVLLILIDGASEDPARDHAVLLNELGSFSEALLRRPRITCYSRCDLVPADEALPELDGMIPLKISAATGQGITELLRRLSEDLAAVRAREPVPAEWVRTIRGPAGEDMDEAGEDVAEDDGARTVGAGAGAAAADQAGAGAGRPEVRTFAELVDAGARLGSMPWPRRFYIDTAPAGGEEESEE